MKDLFVNHDLAIKLKNKGFDAQCLCFYDEEKELRPKSNRRLLSGIERQDLFKDYCLAPTYQQATEWLREDKNIHVYADIWQRKDLKWIYYIVNAQDGKQLHAADKFESCNAALQSGIYKALELI